MANPIVGYGGPISSPGGMTQWVGAELLVTSPLGIVPAIQLLQANGGGWIILEPNQTYQVDFTQLSGTIAGIGIRGAPPSFTSTNGVLSNIKGSIINVIGMATSANPAWVFQGCIFKDVAFTSSLAIAGNQFGIMGGTLNFGVLFEDCLWFDHAPNIIKNVGPYFWFDRCYFGQTATVPASMNQTIVAPSGPLWLNRSTWDFNPTNAEYYIGYAGYTTNIVTGAYWIKDCQFMPSGAWGVDANLDFESNQPTTVGTVHVPASNANWVPGTSGGSTVRAIYTLSDSGGAISTVTVNSIALPTSQILGGFSAEPTDTVKVTYTGTLTIKYVICESPNITIENCTFSNSKLYLVNYANANVANCSFYLTTNYLGHGQFIPHMIHTYNPDAAGVNNGTSGNLHIRDCKFYHPVWGTLASTIDPTMVALRMDANADSVVMESCEFYYSNAPTGTQAKLQSQTGPIVFYATNFGSGLNTVRFSNLKFGFVETSGVSTPLCTVLTDSGITINELVIEEWGEIGQGSGDANTPAQLKPVYSTPIQFGYTGGTMGAVTYFSRQNMNMPNATTSPFTNIGATLTAFGNPNNFWSYIAGTDINALATAASAVSAAGGGTISVGPTYGTLVANTVITLSNLTNVTVAFQGGFNYQCPDSHAALTGWPVKSDSGGTNNRYPLFVLQNCTNCTFQGGNFPAANPALNNNYRSAWMEGGNNINIRILNGVYSGFTGFVIFANGYSLVTGGSAVSGPYDGFEIAYNLFQMNGKAGNDGGDIRIGNATTAGQTCYRVNIHDNRHIQVQEFAIDLSVVGATGLIDTIRIGGQEDIQMSNYNFAGLNFEACGNSVLFSPPGIGVRNLTVEKTVHVVGGAQGLTMGGGYSGFSIGGIYEFNQGNGIGIGAGGGGTASAALVTEDGIVQDVISRNNNQQGGSSTSNTSAIQIGMATGAGNIGTVRRIKIGPSVVCTDTQGYIGWNGTSAKPVSGWSYPVFDTCTLSIAAGSTQTINIFDEFGNRLSTNVATLNAQVLHPGWTLAVTYATLGAVTCTFNGNTNNTPWVLTPTITNAQLTGSTAQPVSGVNYFVAAPLFFTLGAGTGQTYTYTNQSGSVSTGATASNVQLSVGGYLNVVGSPIGTVTVQQYFTNGGTLGSTVTVATPFSPGVNTQRTGIQALGQPTTGTALLEDIEILADANKFLGNVAGQGSATVLASLPFQVTQGSAQWDRFVLKTPIRNSLTSQTAAIASFIKYIPPSSGWFQVGGDLDVTAETGAVNLTATYVDINGSTKTVTVATGASVADFSGTSTFYASGGGTQGVVIATTLGATATYSVNAVLWQIG